MTQLTLREALRAAAEGQLPQGTLFIPSDALTLSSLCLLLDRGEARVQRQRESGFVSGFEREGLDTERMQDVADYARQREAKPSDESLFEEFANCLCNAEKAQFEADRAFFDRLGPEDQNERCRESGCGSGVVRFSALCRRHHFEVIKRRKCPFD